MLAIHVDITTLFVNIVCVDEKSNLFFGGHLCSAQSVALLGFLPYLSLSFPPSADWYTGGSYLSTTARM